MVARDLDEAIGMHAAAPEQFVIGGASLYAEALPRAERIYLTRVHARPAGDVYFPELASGEWGESLVSEHPRRRAPRARVLDLPAGAARPGSEERVARVRPRAPLRRAR